MSIATRLMIALVATMILLVGGYMSISARQWSVLIRTGVEQETGTLARSLHAVLDHHVPADTPGELEEILAATEVDRAAYAIMVVDANGATVAGRTRDLECLREALPPEVLAGDAGQGWARCGGDVFWTARPLGSSGSALVVANRNLLRDQAVYAGLRRQLFLMLSLHLGIAITIPLLLQGLLIRPLSRIMNGVRRLGEVGRMPPIELSRSSGELAELAHAINAMAAQIDEKRAALVREAEEKVALERRLAESEKYALIGRLSGGLAHELGTPLSVIGIRARAIQLAPDAPAATRQSAAVIQAQVRRLTDFVQGLLQMAREQGIVFEPVALRELLSELREEVEAWAASEEVDFVVLLPEAEATVHGQKALLRHALRNLVRNALHALHDHPGPRRVTVRVEVDAEETRVIVEDSGPGISPDDLPRVLEPFYTTRSMGKGMGLGLPITLAIVEEHGGELHLRNREPSGVQAVMALPSSHAVAVDVRTAIGRGGLQAPNRETSDVG